MNRATRLSKALRFIAAAAFIAFAAVIFTQRDYLHDTLQAYQFTPTSAVAAMPAQTGMSDRGKLLFFASQPTLEGTQRFNEVCKNTEKNSMVLGCYTNRKIYLYNVNNPEIDGIEEVTGAHEMLHAAYDRLSDNVKRDVNQLLSSQALVLENVPEFRERMQAYQELPADDRLNELHSIIGSEVSDLPADLEAYYARYFTDRQKTVALYRQYADVFRGLRRDSEELAAQLDRLALEINARSEAYEQASRQLANDIQNFNRRAASGDFASQFVFSSERNQLVARSDQLNGEYRAINEMIRSYNAMRVRYDEVASHLAQLTNSIDSSLAPAPGIE